MYLCQQQVTYSGPATGSYESNKTPRPNNTSIKAQKKIVFLVGCLLVDLVGKTGKKK